MRKTEVRMKTLVDTAARLVRAANKISTQKWSFLCVFAFAFIASVYTLGKLDLLPDPAPAQPTAVAAEVAPAPRVILATTTVSVPAPVAVVELPVKIEISKIKLSTVVENPTATDIELLDKELLKGAVRYPTSGKLGEVGNVVLFGHSSYLPVVGNKAYKAFNDIQKLEIGDTVTVSSSGTSYSYRVTSVKKESTTDAAIPLQVSGKLLTLSTCDSFGAKTDRFVVTAEFVESHPISASA